MAPQIINFFSSILRDYFCTHLWHSVTSRLETSRCRDLFPFFESIGIGLKNFGLGKKVSVSVSIILVSKKVSVSVSKILVSKKVSVSVSMEILVSALSDLWALAISFGSRRTSYWFSRIKVHKEQSHRATITSWICVQWTLPVRMGSRSRLTRLFWPQQVHSFWIY